MIKSFLDTVLTLFFVFNTLPKWGEGGKGDGEFRTNEGGVGNFFTI